MYTLENRERQTFSTTSFPVSLSRALYTTPYVPAPQLAPSFSNRTYRSIVAAMSLPCRPQLQVRRGHRISKSKLKLRMDFGRNGIQTNKQITSFLLQFIQFTQLNS